MSRADHQANTGSRGDANRRLYEADEHSWIEQQIAALRDRRLHDVDRDNLAEYLSDMAARDQRELGNRFVILIQHLLKARMQPEKMTRSWLHTIAHQQNAIRRIFRNIPGIVHHAAEEFAEAYPDAIREAAAETGIPARQFPTTSPWTMEEALAFMPDFPERKVPPRSKQVREK